MKPICTCSEEAFWLHFKTYIQKPVVKKEANNQTLQNAGGGEFAVKIKKNKNADAPL